MDLRTTWQFPAGASSTIRTTPEREDDPSLVSVQGRSGRRRDDPSLVSAQGRSLVNLRVVGTLGFIGPGLWLEWTVVRE